MRIRKRLLKHVMWMMLMAALVALLTPTKHRFSSSFLEGVSEQDDPDVIEYIRQNILYLPSEQPYNLEHPEKMRFSNGETLELILDELFKGERQGTFLEAGAFDGETHSNTLYLERYFSWFGLLVEAMPNSVEKLKRKYRRSWVAPVCLSTKPYPTQMNFSIAKELSHMDNNNLMNVKTLKCGDRYVNMEKSVPDNIQIVENAAMDKENVHVDESKQTTRCSPVPTVTLQCFPLYSLMLASGLTTIDFMSLDIEGSEMDVLRTIPFDKVRIKIIFVEVDKLENKEGLVKWMHQNGYDLLTEAGDYDLIEMFKGDMFFKRRLSRL